MSCDVCCSCLSPPSGEAAVLTSAAHGLKGAFRLGMLFMECSHAGGVFDLSGPRSTAEAIGVLAAIVAIHECGHFAAARLQGIHVTKFSIGFGPPLLSYQVLCFRSATLHLSTVVAFRKVSERAWHRTAHYLKCPKEFSLLRTLHNCLLSVAQGKEVEYSLRAIPLGGYVAFPDDDPDSKISPDDPDLLKNRSIAQRAIVISAGVLANIVFAYGLLFTQASHCLMKMWCCVPASRTRLLSNDGWMSFSFSILKPWWGTKQPPGFMRPVHGLWQNANICSMECVNSTVHGKRGHSMGNAPACR